MLAKLSFGVAVVFGVALWAVGARQAFESDTTGGALIVLAGAVVVIGAIAWRVRDPSEGVSGFVDAVVAFLSRAP